MTGAASDSTRLEIARKLVDDFARRTGLTGEGGDANERYLWTDAFAVQTFFELADVFAEERYRELALKLIAEVHQRLGKFRPDDERQGWISGLSQEEGNNHPTAGGLRIGKKLPERKPNERFDEALEWERDGQYFHYLTRWVQALLRAARETRDMRYAVWAAELVQAGEKFIDNRRGKFRMYWKMSTDLSRPLVATIGYHDALEGLVCAVTAAHAIPEKEPELKPLMREWDKYCQSRHWVTTDSLGIGGLLLDAVRLANLGAEIPESIRPEKLLADCVESLELYGLMHRPDLSAEYRLAFRECGLSLGLRVAKNSKLKRDELDPYMYLADDIEEFWIKPENQKASTWMEHLDINAVTLAASLMAPPYPRTYIEDCENYGKRSP